MGIPRPYNPELFKAAVALIVVLCIICAITGCKAPPEPAPPKLPQYESGIGAAESVKTSGKTLRQILTEIRNRNQ